MTDQDKEIAMATALDPVYAAINAAILRKEDGIAEAKEVLQEQKDQRKAADLWAEFDVDMHILNAARQRQDIAACSRTIMKLRSWIYELTKHEP